MLIGVLVIIYTVSGGTKAVSLTQRQQMAIIIGGMLLSRVWWRRDTLLAELGKLNIVNTEFNLNDRYNIWSGLIAGTFLFLSYFGTDQSQVSTVAWGFG